MIYSRPLTLEELANILEDGDDCLPEDSASNLEDCQQKDAVQSDFEDRG